jgi:ketosteroid isomerase-like protein
VRVPLDPGQYTVEVQKKGYELAQSQHVLVSRGIDTPVAFVLKPLPNESELVITGAPPDAQVQVDGQELGFTGADGGFSQSVEPGSHDIVLVKAGKQSNTIKEKFTVRRRLSLDGRRFIIRQPPPPSLALIVINNLPHGATVKVDGGESHQPDASGTARLELPAGNHSLEISAASFTSRKIEHSFAKGETALDGSLEHVDIERQQYEAGYQRALQQYQQATDKRSLEAARDTLQSIAQAGGSHAADARKYVDDINKKIAALNPPPPPPPVKPPTREQDEGAIRTLVNRYEQAFDSRDADALLKIWPNMGNKKYKDYKNTFAAVSAFHMQVDLGAIDISGTGETATASAILSQTVTVKGGGNEQGKAHRDPAVFELTKSNGNWIINNVR